MSKAFRLKLTGGQCWCIKGEGTRQYLAERLAQLMGLGGAADCQEGGILLFSDSAHKCDENFEPLFMNKQVCISQNSEKNVMRVEVAELNNEFDLYSLLRIGIQLIHHVNVRRGGLPLHAAIAELDGMGMLLAAKGGTGKSTCCQRLPGYWNVLGDDEVLMAKSESTGYAGHPIPTWSHYLYGERIATWRTESPAPIRAIFFLEQAENEALVPLAQGISSLRIYASINPVYKMCWTSLFHAEKHHLNAMLFHNACDMAAHIPTFILKFSRTGEFWSPIEETLWGLSRGYLSIN